MTPHEVAWQRTRDRDRRCWADSAASRTSSARPTAASTTSRCSQYPHASVSPIQVSEPTLVGAGTPPGADLPGQIAPSSQGARDGDPRAGERRAGLPAARRALRETAPRSRTRCTPGISRALGAAMIDNTEAQRQLHPGSGQPRRPAGDRDRPGARRAGLEGERRRRRRRLADPAVRTTLGGQARHAPRDRAGRTALPNIPIYLSRYGLRVWKQEPAV